MKQKTLTEVNVVVCPNFVSESSSSVEFTKEADERATDAER